MHEVQILVDRHFEPLWLTAMLPLRSSREISTRTLCSLALGADRTTSNNADVDLLRIGIVIRVPLLHKWGIIASDASLRRCQTADLSPTVITEGGLPEER